MPDSPEAADRHERVGVFWGLLYLSAQSEGERSQEELDSELWVRNLNAASGEDAPEIPPQVLPE